MAQGMKSLIKRVTIALSLGFVLSWLIPNLLLEIPRRIGTSRINKSQTIIEPELSTNRGFVNIFDYRWFGIYERQFTAQRRFNTVDQRQLMEFWWTWDVIPESRVPLDQVWDEIQSGFDPIEFSPEESQYSIIKVGFPALSFQGRVAINAKAPLPNNTLATHADGFFVPPIIQPMNTIKLAGTESVPAAEYLFAPYQPIYSGLIINTLFYALIMWMLLSIKRAYRHARRMHKGKCPICKYELEYEFVDGCPECGWRKESAATKSS